jgi:high-affinity nickel-transport protein
MPGDGSWAAPLLAGLLLGLQHASDGDHVAAVSALVTRQGSLARSALLGTLWGAGHTVALVAAGVATIVFRLTISPAVERMLETLVALVLIVLGGQVILRAVAGVDAHTHVPAAGIGPRSFVVGLVHGLAGSAALMLLVLSTIPSPLGGLLYVLVFGLGAMLGMLVLSGLVALPFVLTARSAVLHTTIRLAAGAVSLGLGLSLVRHPL